MVGNSVSNNVRNDKPVWLFLFCWTVFNIAQAATLELHADEAYYWVYSRFLAWGYFDHPPMVAVFIKAGYSILHNELGLRLLTVLSSSASLYVMWLMLKRYSVTAISFILVCSGILVFHIYGFTTTPDSPLLLFTVLFLFFYQQYIEKDSLLLTLILGVVVACLLYSKYHGILLVGFTLISNLKLLKRRSFWGIVMLAFVLYIPHILWQMNHGYPSVAYHLSERSSEKYDLSYSYQYPLGQLLMAGPLIGWFVFYKGFTTKVKDAFIRALLFNSIGILFFFFLTSFKGEVQLHWTLIAYVPLAMLALIHLQRSEELSGWFIKLAIANTILIVLLRLCIISGLPAIKQAGAIKSYFGFSDWAKAIYTKAGNNYVIFNEGFQNPSKYNFYNNTVKGFAYDSRYYRRTQYDIWPIEDSLQHKRAYYVLQGWEPGITTDTIITAAGTWYGGWVDNVRTYQKIKFSVPNYRIKSAPGQKTIFDLSFTNPYPFTINFSNSPRRHKVRLEACFFIREKLMEVQKAGNDFYNIILKPGETAHYKFIVTAPEKSARYDLFFSIRTDPFVGGKNNQLINFVVE
ncbi:ArnT family glycosyltransferase [Mucilaginibacter segetis]|uniref:Glycosyltransferase family 39 protein n=1 Tax=Mucilaginibacter segetis TaxID=2793071 RepID=A0A934PWN1_9SPHI|nr:glycosyltransferase family 39 protein [Mucilaginibacter segetis]MBK0380510.1 glycosyltransferase family 39 protein [Mucilaginibacter segetis]